VPRFGQPIELGQATAEDESYGDTPGDGSGQEQPERPGEQRRFKRGEAGKQQRQPGTHAAAAWQAGRDRLADRCGDEDKAGGRAGRGEVADAQDAAQEDRYQLLKNPRMLNAAKTPRHAPVKTASIPGGTPRRGRTLIAWSGSVTVSGMSTTAASVSVYRPR